MDSPQNHIWGPALWMILHSTAERIGSQVLKKLPEEEKRIWIGIINGLRFILPCPQCKKHYIAFLKENPIVLFNKDTIRNWLFQLHEQVNHHTNKTNEQRLTINQLPEIYSKPFQFTKYYAIFAKQVSLAIQLGWCTGEDVRRTARLFEECRRFYDFF